MSYPRIKAGSKVLQTAPRTFPQPSPVPNPPPSAKEITLQTKRRMEKAERDERVDITKALTPVKTYMGGFTRPQDIRISNWWPGGAYLRKSKVYEAPPPAAYEPHTVYLLEARYPTQHGVGRQDSIEYVVGVCREGDLPAIIEKYNSQYCPKEQMEVMDNAVWPWMTQRQKKMVVWWDKGESRREVMARRKEEIYSDSLSASASEKPVGSVDLAAAPAPPAAVQGQKRAFHSSIPQRSDEEKTTTTAAERTAEIPTSAWSRPHKPSQDADDNVVPAYYIERRRQLDEIAERKEEEGGLMTQLAAGILSEGIAAQTRPREEKIPPEIIEEDGTVRFPSGFEPPTPATEFHPVAALPAVDAEDPVVKSGKIAWEEALAPEGEELAASTGSSAQGVSGVRGFHTSAITRAREVPHTMRPRSDKQKTGTTAAERAAAIPASAWSRPHKASQDADDDVVPAYYIERRRQLDAIAERKEEEGGLMAQLAAGILSEGIAAETRPREEKIPPEVIEEDGSVRFPSGFEPPTPATKFHPVAALPPLDTEEPVVKSGKVSWEEALVPESGEFATSASFSAQGASGVRGFHTSAIARAREVPLHNLDTHAAPPQPPAQASEADAPAAPKQKRKEYKLIEKQEDREDFDEFMFENDVVEEVESAVPPVADSVRDFNNKLQQHRDRYMTTLKEKPFWRPVLTATLSTRSLALTYARLSRALPRGLPFYASIDEHDRKYAPTFNSRMHNLRVRRMRQLILDIGTRLRGDCGGFPGIRFSPSDRGRTIGGEGLEAPIPAEKRVIHVGIGEWYRNGESLREVLKEEIDELELGEGFNLFGLDDWGKRSDGVEWSRPQAAVTTKKLSDMLGAEYHNLAPHLRKKKLEEIAEEKGRQIAFALSQRNRRVDYPSQVRASLDTFDDDVIPPSVKPEPAQD